MQSWIESLSMHNPPPSDLWRFLPFGFLLTVLIESPILWLLLPKLTNLQRGWTGVWLTACTYPIVVLVLPTLMVSASRGIYLLVAESFAPIAECWIFWVAGLGTREFERRDWVQSFAAITAANVASFAFGEILWVNGFRPW